jgi:hypothetical protein
MKFWIACATVWAGLAVASGVSASPDADQQIRSLEAAIGPNVKLDKGHALHADVTCDGRKDMVLVGYKRDKIWIGVIASQFRKPMTFEFAVDRAKQAAICVIPVRLRSYPIFCSDEDYGHYDGCRAIKSCKGFAISDGECDPIEFHWNYRDKTLDWIRH